MTGDVDERLQPWAPRRPSYPDLFACVRGRVLTQPVFLVLPAFQLWSCLPLRADLRKGHDVGAGIRCIAARAAGYIYAALGRWSRESTDGVADIEHLVSIGGIHTRGECSRFANESESSDVADDRLAFEATLDLV